MSKKLLFVSNKTILAGILIFLVAGGNTRGQEIQVLSPEPGGIIADNDILIAASFYGMEQFNPDNVQLILDGRDVTEEALVDEDMLTYLMPKLAAGTHRVELRVLDPALTDRPTRQWSFDVAGEQKQLEPTFKYSGKITSGVTYDKVEQEELGVGNMGIKFRGTAYDWIQFRTNLKLTSEEDPLIQPRNRYGFGVSVRDYLDINFGDTNPRLTYLTLNGKRVRGVEVGLHLGFLNLQYVEGELNRSIQGALDADESLIVAEYDTSAGGRLWLDRKGYTFTQNMKAYRLGIGSGEYFQWGFNLIKARDDINSINKTLNDAKVTLDDSTFSKGPGVYTLNELLQDHPQMVVFDDENNWSGATPQDNLVFSTDLGMYFDHRRVLLEGEVAFSLYNKNIWDGALTRTELDTLMPGDTLVDNQIGDGLLDISDEEIDPALLEDWFIINQYMIPLVPIDIRPIQSDTSDITMGEAIMSMPSLAFRTRAALNYFGNFVTVEYSQIGPEYMSLANPYLFRNKREFTISDKVRLLENRLLLTLKYQHQDDDILTTVENVRTQNLFYSSANILPGPGLPTFNLSFRMINRDNGISEIDELVREVVDSNGDTAYVTSYSDDREQTRTINFVGTVNYRFTALYLTHDVAGTFVTLNKADQLSNRDLDTTFIAPGLESNVLNLSLSTRFPFAFRSIININTNSSKFHIGPEAVATQSVNKIGVDGEYTGIMGRRLIILAGFNLAQGSGQVPFNWIGFKSGVRWNIIENLNLNATGEFRVKEANNTSSNTVIGRATLSYLFR